MLRKSVKITIEVTSIISILTMLAVVSLLVWVMIAPRTLFFITPYLERELSSVNANYKVKIDDSIIKWDSVQRSISIHSNNVRVLNATNDTVATFPEVSFGFSLLRFLRGHIFSPDITLIGPNFYANTASKILYVTPERVDNIGGVIANSVSMSLNGDNDSFKIHSIRVKDAKMFISTSNMDMLWQIDEGYAKLERVKGKRRIKSEFKINFGKDFTYFSIEAESVGEKVISAEVNFQRLPSYTLSDIFPDYQIERKISMYFTGLGKLLVTEGAITNAQLIIESAYGKVTLPEFFKENLNIKNLVFDAKLTDNLGKLVIEKFQLDLQGPILQVKGFIKNEGQWPGIKPSLELEAEVLNITTNELEHYWPYNFGSVAREWVLHNIRNAVVKRATGKFNFSAGDISNIVERANASEKTELPPIPVGAIDATINLDKAYLSYLPKYPEINDVNAIVKFTGQTMDAQITSGKMLSTNISNVHVKFDNLWQHHLKIGVIGDFAGEASNLVEFLKLSNMAKPQTAAMASIYNMTGQVFGSIDLTIPIMPGLKYDDVDIVISSSFKNTVLPGFLNNKNILANKVDFLLDKYDISAKGEVLVNNIPATIDLSKHFSNAEDENLQLKVQGVFSPSEIKDLGLAEIPFTTGKMGLDLNIKMRDNSLAIAGSADLTQSAVKFSNWGFEKPAGKIGNANFDLIKIGKEKIDIKDFKLKGDDFAISGNLKLDNDLSNISELNLTTAKFGSNDFVATYKSSVSDSALNIQGKSLDLSGASINEWFRQDPSNIKKSFIMKVDLNNLFMKNGELLGDFSSDLKCSANICSSGNLYGKIKNTNYIVMSLKNIGDRSALLVESDNAGAVVNAMNISKNIIGGHLNIDSTVGKSNGIAVAAGVIKIQDFTAVRTPLLGKILTLASFRGFEDLLNNQGISFKKFEAPFTMASGLITVKEAKSSGASIGITAEGTVNTVKDEIDLKGVIVPAYTVNNMIGKIPFVGKIIIGKENEGIIATKYSIKGSYDDAKVNVNPLSILAPGFVRNIFDIFD